MGAKGSKPNEQLVQKKTQYDALRIIADDYKKEIQKLTETARNQKNPLKFKESSSKAFQNYLQELKKLNLLENHVNDKNECVKLIVGGISSGKSSLINSFFGANLDVGIGQTTKQIVLAHETMDDDVKILIYDTPGESEAFNTHRLDNVYQISQSNQVFILFNSSLKNIEHMVRTIAAIKPNNTFLIRTQCDRFQSDFSRTLDEEINQDKKLLKKWGISQVQHYATTAIRTDFQNQAALYKMTHKCRKYINRNDQPQK